MGYFNIDSDYVKKIAQEEQSKRRARLETPKARVAVTVQTGLLQMKPQTKDEQLEELINAAVLPLAKNQVNMISAKGGEYKSFVALESARACASQGLKVLCIFSEDTLNHVVNRLHILHRLNGTTIEEVDKNLGVLSLNELMELELDINELTKQMQDGYDLVIVDPLLAFYKEDENNNVQAKKFMNELAKACMKAETTALVLHHSAKGTTNSRGAGAFTDACRIVYHREEKASELDEVDGTATFKVYKENVGIKYLLGTDTFPIRVREAITLNDGSEDEAPE